MISIHLLFSIWLTSNTRKQLFLCTNTQSPNRDFTMCNWRAEECRRKQNKTLGNNYVSQTQTEHTVRLVMAADQKKQWGGGSRSLPGFDSTLELIRRRPTYVACTHTHTHTLTCWLYIVLKDVWGGRCWGDTHIFIYFDVKMPDLTGVRW